MADKSFEMEVELTDGRKVIAGRFTVPQGETGPAGAKGEQGVGVEDLQITPGSSTDEGMTYNLEATLTDGNTVQCGDILVQTPTPLKYVNVEFQTPYNAESEFCFAVCTLINTDKSGYEVDGASIEYFVESLKTIYMIDTYSVYLPASGVYRNSNDDNIVHSILGFCIDPNSSTLQFIIEKEDGSINKIAEFIDVPPDLQITVIPLNYKQ